MNGGEGEGKRHKEKGEKGVDGFGGNFIIGARGQGRAKGGETIKETLGERVEGMGRREQEGERTRGRDRERGRKRGREEERREGDRERKNEGWKEGGRKICIGERTRHKHIDTDKHRRTQKSKSSKEL